MTADERERFLAERSRAIGGSDLRDLLGVEGGCPRRLHYDKTRVPADFPFLGNRQTRRGEVMEGVIVEEWLETMRPGWFAEEVDWLLHASLPAGAHVDRWIYQSVDEHNFGWNHGVLEVKCPAVRQFLKVKMDGPSLASILQLQWGMNVSNSKWGIILNWNCDRWEGLESFHERDDQLIADLEALIGEHALTWKEDNPFVRLDPHSLSCRTCPWRRKCQGIDEVWMEEEERAEPSAEFETDENIVVQYAAVLEAQQRYKDASALLEEAKAALIEKLSGRPRLRCGLGRVSYLDQHRKAYQVSESRFKVLRVQPDRPDRELYDGLDQ